MKLKILSTLLLSVFFGTHLSYAEEPAKTNTVELCSEVEELAGVIMERRQSGAPMSLLIKTAEGNEVAEKIIIEAYEKSRFSTESYQKKSIENFKSRWFLKCFKGLKALKNK